MSVETLESFGYIENVSIIGNVYNHYLKNGAQCHVEGRVMINALSLQ